MKGNYDETKYKLYMADTGLLVSMLDEEAQDDLRAHKNLGDIRVRYMRILQPRLCARAAVGCIIISVLILP